MRLTVFGCGATAPFATMRRRGGGTVKVERRFLERKLPRYYYLVGEVVSPSGTASGSAISKVIVRGHSGHYLKTCP